METRPLDVWENLMIRACKQQLKSDYRFKRIFGKRCGLDIKYVKTEYIIEFLVGIIERYNLCGLVKFLERVREHQSWNNMTKRTDDPVLTAAISILAMTPVAYLPNYHSPLCFRKSLDNSGKLP